MELVKKNKTFAENVVYNYLNNLDDGEDIVQFWYGVAIDNYDIKLFRGFYNKCYLKPNQEVRGLIGKIFLETKDEKFSKLLNEF